MNTQEFENISLDLLMGRLTPEEKEKFLSCLTSQERAELSEKERMFNLVKKTGEVHSTPPKDLVDRIMTEVRKEGFSSNKKGFMDASVFKKIAVPTALTMTIALALVTSNKMITDKNLRPGMILEAEKPVNQGNEAYEDTIKYISSDDKNTQAAVREQVSQLDRMSKEQKASQEKLTGVISEVVNRIETLDEGLKKVENAKLDSPAPVQAEAPAKAKQNRYDVAGAKDLERDTQFKRQLGSQPENKAEPVDRREKAFRPTSTDYASGKAVSDRQAELAGSAGMPRAQDSFDILGSANGEALPPMQDKTFARNGAMAAEEAMPVASSPIFAPPQFYGEKYGQAEERAPILVSSEPVSTFSIDVDTGGYTNLRKLILGGSLPQTAAVRIEEMINYFDYNYPTLDGPEPFAFSYEAAPSPYDANKVFLKLGIKAKATTPKTEQGWNLVFLVDVSGSMADSDKLPLLKDSMKIFVEHMRPTDKLSIVTYAGNAGVLLEPTSGNQKDKIFNAINSLSYGGSTNGGGGIIAAYQQAEKNLVKGGVNRVILATDGDFNVGISSFDGLVKLIEEKLFF